MMTTCAREHGPCWRAVVVSRWARWEVELAGRGVGEIWVGDEGAVQAQRRQDDILMFCTAGWRVIHPAVQLSQGGGVQPETWGKGAGLSLRDKGQSLTLYTWNLRGLQADPQWGVQELAPSQQALRASVFLQGVWSQLVCACLSAYALLITSLMFPRIPPGTQVNETDLDPLEFPL